MPGLIPHEHFFSGYDKNAVAAFRLIDLFHAGRAWQKQLVAGFRILGQALPKMLARRHIGRARRAAS
jgi:hypothetical protein